MSEDERGPAYWSYVCPRGHWWRLPTWAVPRWLANLLVVVWVLLHGRCCRGA